MVQFRDARFLLIDPRRDQVLRLRDAGRQGIIHTECAEKETLANAQRTLSDADFAIAIGECTTDKVTTTVTGTLTVKSSSAVNSLGPWTSPSSDTPSRKHRFQLLHPYQATTNTTLTPGAPATFTISVPYDPNMSDKTECGASMVSWWPSNM